MAYGVFEVGDQVKPEAKAAIDELHSSSINTWLVTGDSESAAISIGSEVGIPIDHIFASASPSDKLEFVSKLQENGKVIMIGDGINDAAAIAAGVTHVQGTLNGYGERTGNADLVNIIANLELKKDKTVLPAGKLQEAFRISHAVAEITNVPLLVMIGKSPMKTVCDLISPVMLLVNSAVKNNGAA